MQTLDTRLQLLCPARLPPRTLWLSVQQDCCCAAVLPVLPCSALEETDILQEHDRQHGEANGVGGHNQQSPPPESILITIHLHKGKTPAA